MEIREMMMSDIESRLSQIQTELGTPEADIDALTAEVDALEERKRKSMPKPKNARLKKQRFLRVLVLRLSQNIIRRLEKWI